METSSGISDIAHSIQLAVAPVFLLSGVGVILTVLTNRLARIVDRARFLEPLFAQAPELGRAGLLCFLLEIRAATASLRFGPGPH